MSQITHVKLCSTTKNTEEPFKMKELSSANFHRGSVYLLKKRGLCHHATENILRNCYHICNFKIKDILIEHNINKAGNK